MKLVTGLNTTLTKGLFLLELMAKHPSGKRVTEIAKDLDLPKSSTHRLLQTLCALEFVQYSEDKIYRPTMKIWELGILMVNKLPIGEIGRKYLQELRQLTGETVYLAAIEGKNTIYLDRLDPLAPMEQWTRKGGRVPAHCTAYGKAILAAQFELDQRVPPVDFSRRYTHKTIHTHHQLESDITNTARRGIAIDKGEYRHEVYSFGAAIKLSDGTPIASVGVSVPDHRLSVITKNEICKRVQNTANAISNILSAKYA